MVFSFSSSCGTMKQMSSRIVEFWVSIANSCFSCFSCVLAPFDMPIQIWGNRKSGLVIAWIFVRRSPDVICPGRGFSFDDVNFVNPFHGSDCVRSTRSRFVWLCQKKQQWDWEWFFFRNTDANSRFTMMTIMKCPSIDPNSFLASSCSLFLLVETLPNFLAILPWDLHPTKSYCLRIDSRNSFSSKQFCRADCDLEHEISTILDVSLLMHWPSSLVFWNVQFPNSSMSWIKISPTKLIPQPMRVQRTYW